jgi:Uma2 family endonuclease
VSTASRLITYEDTFLLPEDKLAEVVKGELRRMPPPSLRHARLIEKLASLLRGSPDAGRFEVLVTAFGQMIRKQPLTYRIPDLGVYLREKLTDEHYISVVPELLVEVISPASRKGSRDELIADYADLKVPELWLLQPDERKIHRMLFQSGGLVAAGIFSEGSIAPQRIPNLAIPLSELWDILGKR